MLHKVLIIINEKSFPSRFFQLMFEAAVAMDNRGHRNPLKIFSLLNRFIKWTKFFFLFILLHVLPIGKESGNDAFVNLLFRTHIKHDKQ